MNMPPKHRSLNYYAAAKKLPWHRGPAARPPTEDLTATLVHYIDEVTSDELIFQLGATYRSAKTNTPLDLDNMADLSDLLVASLKVVPTGRIRKTDMRTSVLEAILERPKRVSDAEEPHKMLAERVSKQVLRVCFMFRRNCRGVAFCWKNTYVHRRSVVRIHMCNDASASASACEEM